MKKSLTLCMFSLFIGLFSLTGHAKEVEPKVLVIEKTDTAWNGTSFVYPPNDKPYILSAKVKIPRGTSISWHLHEVPSLAYVEDGTLTIEDEFGNTKTFKEGDTLVETMNVVHRGFAGDDDDVELIVFYLGSEGKALTKKTPQHAHKK